MTGQFETVVTDFITEPLDHERGVLGEIASVAALDAFHEEDLAGRIENAAALMVYHRLSITRLTIDRLENCKVIAVCGVGYDNVDHISARASGIPVVNVPDYGTEEVADSAIGMLLSLTRGISFHNSRLREHQGEWNHRSAVPLMRLRGQVLGIVGLGRIGTALALRGKALGMDVVFYDPYVSDGYDKSLGIRRVEHLDDLLKQAYVLSLHCPLTDETRMMIDGRAIATMQRNSYLINTSRGEIVETSAIPDAIVSGRLAGAGIDVLKTEPPDEDDPLIAAWRDSRHPAYHRLLINPHAAFYSEQGVIDMRTKGAEACRRALLGHPLRNIVNADAFANRSSTDLHQPTKSGM